MTAPELIDLWDARDSRYSRFQVPLKEEDREGLRWYRRQEIEKLLADDQQRAVALAYWRDWRPPLIV